MNKSQPNNGAFKQAITLNKVVVSGGFNAAVSADGKSMSTSSSFGVCRPLVTLFCRRRLEKSFPDIFSTLRGIPVSESEDSAFARLDDARLITNSLSFSLVNSDNGHGCSNCTFPVSGVSENFTFVGANSVGNLTFSLLFSFVKTGPEIFSKKSASTVSSSLRSSDVDRFSPNNDKQITETDLDQNLSRDCVQMITMNHFLNGLLFLILVFSTANSSSIKSAMTRQKLYTYGAWYTFTSHVWSWFVNQCNVALFWFIGIEVNVPSPQDNLTLDSADFNFIWKR